MKKIGRLSTAAVFILTTSLGACTSKVPTGEKQRNNDENSSEVLQKDDEKGLAGQAPGKERRYYHIAVSRHMTAMQDSLICASGPKGVSCVSREASFFQAYPYGWSYSLRDQLVVIPKADKVIALTSNCALQENGELVCWLLNGRTAKVPDRQFKSVQHISTGSAQDHCVLDENGLFCWKNIVTSASNHTLRADTCTYKNQLEKEDCQPRSYSQKILTYEIPEIGRIVEVDHDDGTFCALSERKEVHCWAGSEKNGKILYGTGTMFLGDFSDIRKLRLRKGRNDEIEVAVLADDSIVKWNFSKYGKEYDVASKTITPVDSIDFADLSDSFVAIPAAKGAIAQAVGGSKTRCHISFLKGNYGLECSNFQMVYHDVPSTEFVSTPLSRFFHEETGFVDPITWGNYDGEPTERNSSDFLPESIVGNWVSEDKKAKFTVGPTRQSYIFEDDGHGSWAEVDIYVDEDSSPKRLLMHVVTSSGIKSKYQNFSLNGTYRPCIYVIESNTMYLRCTYGFMGDDPKEDKHLVLKRQI